MKNVLNIGAKMRGRARLSTVQNDLQPRSGDFSHNAIMSDWASVFANFAVTGSSNLKISAMYLEYENVPTAGDPVTSPAFETSEGIEYFNSLASDSSRDYLRVFLSGASVDSSDEALWPDGNIAKFFAMTSGASGVHGKPFSDASNSTVYGGALVVVRSLADATQDLIVSRLYFDSGKQQTKLSTSQIGVDWEIEFN